MADRPRNELLVAFGVAVRTLRRDQGWSQEAFADRVGLHRTYMGDIERGERNLGLVNVGRIAEALGVPPSKLLVEAERSPDKR